MKKILIMALVSTLALINVQAEETNIEVCKTYINEAKNFQATMETNKVSEATLSFYKDQVVAHCGNIVAKVPYEKNFFAKSLMKKDANTVKSCKMAINMAKSYVESANVSPFITNAHKINVVDNCGTLVAKKEPAYCFFDVVDNSNEDLKSKCLASIEKAHAAMGTEAIASYKQDVITNCGKLQANL